MFLHIKHVDEKESQEESSEFVETVDIMSLSLSLQAPRLMWESVCMDVRAAADTAISTAGELSHATLSTSFILPRIPAWAVSGKYEFGMTTRVLIHMRARNRDL